jgi:hypothetical protein
MREREQRGHPDPPLRSLLLSVQSSNPTGAVFDSAWTCSI